mgnify:CR=1 FL=1
MSRVKPQKSNRGRKPKPPPRTYADYTDEERSARLNYSEIPNNVGIDAAAQRISQLWGLTVSPGTVKRDTNSGRLTANLVAGRLHYSDRALYEYVILNSNTTAPRMAAV